jgi:O-acetyl-ADP-ribose deacetylase (regulator of RNase III)
MALLHTKGNLIDQAEAGAFNIIVQGCNCHCVQGSGIAGEFRVRYPEVFAADCKTEAGDYNKLGNYTVALGKQFNVINAYTQYDTNRGFTFSDLFEYDAFAVILQKLLKQYPGCNFGFPLIGCGLAGGDKETVVAMLEDFAAKIEETGGTVTLVEFAKV